MDMVGLSEGPVVRSSGRPVVVVGNIGAAVGTPTGRHDRRRGDDRTTGRPDDRTERQRRSQR